MSISEPKELALQHTILSSYVSVQTAQCSNPFVSADGVLGIDSIDLDRDRLLKSTVFWSTWQRLMYPYREPFHCMHSKNILGYGSLISGYRKLRKHS